MQALDLQVIRRKNRLQACMLLAVAPCLLASPCLTLCTRWTNDGVRATSFRHAAAIFLHITEVLNSGPFWLRAGANCVPREPSHSPTAHPIRRTRLPSCMPAHAGTGHNHAPHKEIY
jgi:hypothetical protein